MDEIVSIVCSYLRIDENLFFCSKNCVRVIEAKKYVSYFAYKVKKIPPSKVSSYLGVSERRASITIDKAKSVEQSLYHNSQTVNDIKELSKIIN